MRELLSGGAGIVKTAKLASVGASVAQRIKSALAPRLSEKATKSTTTPNEPSTSEICVRPR